MKITAIEKFLKMKSDELKKAKTDRIASLKNMTSLMDNIADGTEKNLKQYGVCADQDVVEKRRLEHQNVVKQEVESIETLRNKIELHSVTLLRKNQALADEEKAKRDVDDARKLKEKLEQEAESLMMKANALKLHNETDPDLKELKDEVK